MSASFQRSVEHVCRSCRAQQHLTFRPQPRAVYYQNTPRQKPQQNRNASTQAASRSERPSSSTQLPRETHRKPVSPTVTSQAVKPSESKTRPVQRETPPVKVPPNSPDDPTAALNKVRGEISSLEASQVVAQARVLEILAQLYQVANQIKFADTFASEERNSSNVGSGSLLADLDEPDPSSTIPNNTNSQSSGTSASRVGGRAAGEVCRTAYDLLKLPTIHINEKVLESYIRIVCSLNKPEFLPEIFFLYANKPVPIEGSNPVEYKTPNPNSATQAIPRAIADYAIDTAIISKDLPLAIAIIDTTVATRAFRRNKFLRKAAPGLTLGSVFPLAVYASADWLSHWQNTLEPSQAKAIGIAAGAAYVGTFGTIAYVALTTWNDHHERVRWVPGTPLHWRWTREEERLYFDRIAMAWGFQNKRRRGEETGEEWEALRYELGMRSFVLDQTDLMEGMQ